MIRLDIPPLRECLPDLEHLAQATQLQADNNLLGNATTQSITLAELENAYIHRILEITQGNKVQAAKILGIDRGTLYRKLGDDQI